MGRENDHRRRVARWMAAPALAMSIVVSAQAPVPSAAAVALPASPAVHPKFEVTPLEQGDLLMARQRYQAAIEAYKKVPGESAEAWNKMGVSYQLLLNTEDALKCYQKAAKLDPKNASVLNNIGAVYVTLKKYSAAEKSYRKALKIDPKSALFHKNLGTALLADHKYKKGWASYQEALAIDPDVFEHSASFRVQNPASLQDRGAMNYYMAKGCVKAGMNDRAVEYLRMALNEGFTNPRKIIADSEFAALRDVPAFKELMASQGVH